MKILYGVPGEGMGHATRSKVVVDFLLKQGHDVRIVSSSRAYQFLNKEFPGGVLEIKGFHFAYENAEVSRTGTFLLNLKSAGRNLLHNFSQKLLIESSFEPDVVISDFESFTFFFARLHKLPLVSIDNMQVMNRCSLDLDIASEERTNFQLAKNIVRAKVPGCDHYFITSFFDAAVRKSNTTIVPPIIRKAIQDARVSCRGHILMYQTSSSLQTVKQTLQELPDETFFVYGMNRDLTDGNITFKPFSEKGFIEDLASARAVIANGGFSFLSEAVYLRKPVYSFPIQNQFEQWMNAAYIQKLKFGRHFRTLSADGLKAFLYDLPHFEEHLAQYSQDGNELLFSALVRELKRLA